MCKEMIEIHYVSAPEDKIQCNHIVSWEAPSRKNKTCNGIKKVLVYNRLKPCKHCWVLAGNRKQAWRHAGLRSQADGLTRGQRASMGQQQLSYPIQSKSYVNDTGCPTWQPKHLWRTREWANRSLMLRWRDCLEGVVQEKAVDIESTRRIRARKHYTQEQIRDIWREQLERIHIHNIDEDVVESRLYQNVELTDLRPNQATMCVICQEDFGSATGAGSGEMRRLPCNDTFCLDCIKTHFDIIKRRNEHDEDEDHRVPTACPLCRVCWTVKHHPKREMSSRYVLWRAVDFARMRAYFAFPKNSKVRSLDFTNQWKGPVVEYIVAALIFPLLIPTLKTVDHTMRIWNGKTKTKDKLPLLQLLLVGFAGMAIQVFWCLLVGFFPWLTHWCLLRPWTWKFIGGAGFAIELCKKDSRFEFVRSVRGWIGAVCFRDIRSAAVSAVDERGRQQE